MQYLLQSQDNLVYRLKVELLPYSTYRENREKNKNELSWVRSTNH